MNTKKDLVFDLKNYFLESKNNSINPKFYLTTFAITPGFIILKKLCNETVSFFQLIKYKIIFFFGISKLSNYKVLFYPNQNRYENVIVTWNYGNDFLRNGSFNDKYLNINSKMNKKVLWLVVCLDDKVPKKIDKNIALFIRKRINHSDVVYLFKIFIRNLINILFLKLNKCRWSYLDLFAEIFWLEADKILRFNKIKKLITLYEAQPFQNYLNLMKKIKNDKIKTIGYVHSTEAFPTHLYKRDGAPDVLLVHGKDQKYHCVKFLNWKEKFVKVKKT